MDFDTTIVEKFEPVACIIADIWLFLFMAYRNCDSQNGNVYTHKTIAMSVFEAPFQLERKLFSGLK